DGAPDSKAPGSRPPAEGSGPMSASRSNRANPGRAGTGPPSPVSKQLKSLMLPGFEDYIRLTFSSRSDARAAGVRKKRSTPVSAQPELGQRRPFAVSGKHPHHEELTEGVRG